MSKQFILDVFDQKKADRVPVGLWWHFTDRSEWGSKAGDPVIFKRAFEGHRDYVKEAKIDLLKVMPDVYFVLPNLDGVDILDAEQLKAVKPADSHDPFYESQVKLVKQLTEEIGDEAAVFPTVFSPYYYLLYSQLRSKGAGVTEVELAQAVKNHPEALKHAVDVVAQDLITLSKRLLTEAGADGIFYAVHNFNTITKVDYLNIFTPAERLIADEIAAIKDYTILHVCGSVGKPNDFSYYANYPYKALNYSVENEKLSLKEAKEKFPDKVIIGGFSRDEGSILYTGTKEQLQAATEKLVEEAGRDRLIIGADCSLTPEEMSYEKVAWIKEKADTL